MRVFSSFLVILLFYQLLNAAQDKAVPATEVILKEGEILPGPFHAFLLNGPRKDRLHALINEKPDKTFILMFFQCSSVPEYLGKSLEDLNSNIKGNKSKGFPTSAMAIFVNPDIKNVVKDDEKRNDFVKAIRAAISEEKSDFIEVAVDDLNDLKNYKLGNATTVLMLRCENLKVIKMLNLDASSSNAEGFSKALDQLLELPKGK
ncbi:MAG: hypothetical protein ACOYNM_00005 [Gemmataceae bacterium]|jgi:hypothetical protein